MSNRQLVGYPGRPRGGLTVVPSRHLQQVPTSTTRGRRLYKSAPPRTHPSCPPLLGPMPSGAYVVPTLGSSPKWSPLDNHKCTSVIYRPVSLFVLGGLMVPPPLCSKARRSLRSRPNQVSRQDPAGQQSWTCVCPTHPSSRGTPSSYRTHPSCPTAPFGANMARPLASPLVLLADNLQNGWLAISIFNLCKRGCGEGLFFM
jgi:hypothetical protein